MPVVTLHRADRILKSIDKVLKERPAMGTAKLSVFGDVNLAFETARADLQKTLSDSIKLLYIRHAIRGVIGKLQAEHGITALLAEQASMERIIAMLEALPGVGPRRQPEVEDSYARRRKPKAPPELMDVAAVAALAQATKARYESAGDGATTEIEVSVVLPEDVAGSRAIVTDCRRKLDTISDNLRSFNATVTLNLPDSTMEILQAQGIV